MLRAVASALVLGAAMMPARAQDPCAATYRELSRPTPRAILLEVADSVLRRPLAGDGTTCGVHGAPALATTWYRAGTQVQVRGRLLAPTARVDILGGLPQAAGSGAAWTGRGPNFFLRAGVAVDAGRLHAVIAPELWRAANRAYDIYPSGDTARSSFAAPFYVPPYSIDVPSRHGTSPITMFGPGQSAVWVATGSVDIGFSTSSQQWGPGRRGGLVLGADAPGVPRAFVRTRQPVGTPAGAWSAAAFTGTLTESRFFDRDSSNDYRTLTGVHVTWSAETSSPLRIGFSHASMRMGGYFTDGDSGGEADQVNAVHAELIGRGSRVYAELARAGKLPSIGRFLAVPYGGIAYLAGFEHVMRRPGGSLLLSAELANLEQPTDVRGDSTFDFYTSRHVPQGWTQRGQVLGYPTGPGSNHQSLSLDWVSAGWSAGVFGDRTRHNEDALYRQYLAYPWRHDVTMRAGVRGGYVIGSHEVTVEVSTGKRLNYLFQNGFGIVGYRSMDVSVPQLRIGISPRIGLPQ